MNSRLLLTPGTPGSTSLIRMPASAVGAPGVGVGGAGSVGGGGAAVGGSAVGGMAVGGSGVPQPATRLTRMSNPSQMCSFDFVMLLLSSLKFRLWPMLPAVEGVLPVMADVDANPLVGCAFYAPGEGKCAVDLGCGHVGQGFDKSMMGCLKVGPDFGPGLVAAGFGVGLVPGFDVGDVVDPRRLTGGHVAQALGAKGIPVGDVAQQVLQCPFAADGARGLLLLGTSAAAASSSSRAASTAASR